MALALVACSTPYWSSVVDDHYITLTFAHELVERGRIGWPGGGRVEGFTSLGWVLILALLDALHLDVPRAAQAVSLAAGYFTAGLAAWRLDWRGVAGPAALALACWSGLSYWSADGMETTTYALVLALGWALVVDGRRLRIGLGLLLLAVVFRPEANAVLLGALVLRARQRWTLVATTAAWLAYHAWRASYFEGLLPTPFLVKVLSPDGSILHALPAWLADLAIGAIPLSLIARARSLNLRRAALPLLPLAVHAASALSIGGDWMGWSRLLLPGVVASAAGLLAVTPGPQRTASRAWWLPALLGCALAANPNGTHLIGPRPVPTLHPLRTGLGTPLSEDVAFLVRQAPWDATVVLTDVGMPSQIPGLRILDAYGLAWRPAALAAAGMDSSFGDAFLAMVHDPEQRPVFLRSSRFDGVEPSDLPGPLEAKFHEQQRIVYGGGVVRWFRGREGLPDGARIIDRWQDLATRFPSQPFLRWQLAMALADQDRWPQARSVGDELWSRYPDFMTRGAIEASLSFPRASDPAHYDSDRGAALYWDSEARSRPLAQEEWRTASLDLDADDPGEDGAMARIVATCDCGGSAPTEVAVRGPTRLPLPPWPECAPTRARVQVQFTNDQSDGKRDRNLYVNLSSTVPN